MMKVHRMDDRLNEPILITEASVFDNDTVVFPGGYGTIRDLNQNHDARRLLHKAVSGDSGKALVVCQAV